MLLLPLGKPLPPQCAHWGTFPKGEGKALPAKHQFSALLSNPDKEGCPMKHSKPKLSNENLSGLCRQLAMLLRAGIPVGQGLELLAQDAETAKDQALFLRLEALEQEKGNLTDALEETGLFPEYLRRMVRLGEEAGRLDDVMTSLADHYDREASLRDSIRGAVLYPLVMLGMLLAILAVLLGKVMPVFDQVFAQLGTRLTGLSRVLMDLGLGLRQGSVVLAVLALALVGAAFWLKAKPALAFRLLRAFPWSRNICEKTALCRLAGALSLALSSGLNTQYALELAGELTGDPDFCRRLSQAGKDLEENGDLTAALRRAKILTGAHSHLALVGSRTGALDDAFSRIAEECRAEADRSAASAIALIEPSLVAVLSVLVGIVLLSVLAPMLGILSAM